MSQNYMPCTLKLACFESVSSASFHSFCGKRNDAPRAMANSDKEISQLKQTTNPESSNPASSPTADPKTRPPAQAKAP